MPIKPENRARYPENWSEIREAILARAGNRCEQCKAPNRTLIARGAGDDDGAYRLESFEVFSAETGEYLGRRLDFSVARMVKVVLTIAHLDHIPEHCEPENLRAWCQRCHLRYDAEHHRTNARATRRARLSTPDLFAEMEAVGVARIMPASADENTAVMPPQMRTQTLR